MRWSIWNLKSIEIGVFRASLLRPSQITAPAHPHTTRAHLQARLLTIYPALFLCKYIAWCSPVVDFLGVFGRNLTIWYRWKSGWTNQTDPGWKNSQPDPNLDKCRRIPGNFEYFPFNIWQSTRWKTNKKKTSLFFFGLECTNRSAFWSFFQGSLDSNVEWG